MIPSGFRVEDITFKKARRQSEIDKELSVTRLKQDGVEAPVSLTLEQVMSYYKDVANNTEDEQTKKLFNQTVNWLQELQTLRQKLLMYTQKEEREETANTKLEEDI